MVSDNKGMVNDWDAANDSPTTDAATAAHFPPLPQDEFDTARAELLGDLVPPRVGHLRTYKGTALVLALCFFALVVASPPLTLWGPWAQAVYGVASVVAIGALARMFWFVND